MTAGMNDHYPGCDRGAGHVGPCEPNALTHVHQWRADSDAFTSWRDCLTCGKREWFMEVDLP